jgi:hypothetical protein
MLRAWETYIIKSDNRVTRRDSPTVCSCNLWNYFTFLGKLSYFSALLIRPVFRYFFLNIIYKGTEISYGYWVRKYLCEEHGIFITRFNSQVICSEY